MQSEIEVCGSSSYEGNTIILDFEEYVCMKSCASIFNCQKYPSFISFSLFADVSSW